MSDNKKDKDDEEKKDDVSQQISKKKFSSKPVSTVVGRAFDAMELAILQDEINKDNQENKKEEKKGILGKSLDALKQTFSSRNKKEDLEMKAALDAIKDGKDFLEKKKKSTPNFIENKSNVKVIKTLKESDKEQKEKKKEKLDKPINIIENNIPSRKDNNDKTLNNIKKSKDIEEFDDYEEEYEQEIQFRKKEVEELSNEFSKNIKKVFNRVNLFAIKFSGSIIKLGLMLIKPILKILPNKAKNKDINQETKESIKDEVNESVKNIPKIITASFNDIIPLNITFTDNYDVPLYKKSNNLLSKAEEEIILANSILAIQQCAEFTKESPPVTSGFYKDKNIEDIMINVSNEDIKMFLGYVKDKPKKYISKNWKISETFATWLINNSPM
ncbi:MAG: hypothetical protein AABZ74_18495 [Cyanobacteriota bacterium]